MVTARSTAGARREDILQAAVTEFAQAGLAGTSTEAIAARAQISQPYLFRLFGTKKALFMAAAGRVHERIVDAFEQAAARAITEGRDPFLEMGLAYMELLGNREELLVQLHAYAACSDPEVRATVRRRYGELWGWLRTLPGATPDRVRQFMAIGMLLNVVAAQGLMEVVADESWAAECVPTEQDVVAPAGASVQAG